MCFWYQIARPPGTGPVSVAATLRQSDSWCGEDLVAARMRDARDLQVVRVERLVADGRVGPAAEGAQHRRRDVARAGPHRDPLRHGRVSGTASEAVLPAPQRIATPATAARTEAANTAIFAAAKSASSGNACAAMNSDIVKPMPASAPAPASCRQEYSSGLLAMPEPHRERRSQRHARAACRPRARRDRAISGSWPREHRGDRARRPRWRARRAAAPGSSTAARPCAACGPRATRAGRGSRRARAARAPRDRDAAPRPRCRASAVDDRVGLRHQRVQVRRRPRRDEQREQHARERRVQAAGVHADPQRDAEQRVGRRRDRRRARLSSASTHDDRRGAGEIAEVRARASRRARRR